MPDIICFIDEVGVYKCKTHFHVCSFDPHDKHKVITIHDIKQTREEAEEALEQVKAGTHLTQTHPAGSFLVYKDK